MDTTMNQLVADRLCELVAQSGTVGWHDFCRQHGHCPRLSVYVDGQCTHVNAPVGHKARELVVQNGAFVWDQVYVLL
jgi:hypothetical protein